MRLQIAIITLLFSSFVKASCEAESCNTIVEFSTSYVQAVLEKDELKLEKHFYDERYTCFLDKLEFKARYTGHEIVEDKLLDGDNLEHFMLTVRSEATKMAVPSTSAIGGRNTTRIDATSTTKTNDEMYWASRIDEMR